MKKVLALIAFIGFAGNVSAQLWTNPITGTNPNTSNPYTTGDVVDAAITVSGIGRGSGIAGSNANNRYAASGWNSSALDLNDYFDFTLTPNSGCQISFTDFTYTGQVSGTGPVSFEFRSSVDGFTAPIGTPTAAGTTISLGAAQFQSIGSAITFRLYAWGATSATGTFSVNDFTFNGSASCGPVCTPPATQASSFVTSNITNSGADISWTSGSSGNVLVLIHAGSAVNADPSSGTGYIANAVYGSGTQIGTGNYVVYNGTGTSVTVSGLAPGTTYYVAVYEYDPNGGSPCYNLAELTGSLSTTGSASGCFEIESILVDGCDGSNEGLNEMVRFKVGSTPLNVADLSVTWPNNPYLGICQNATTAAGVATINATIQACGYVKEPVLGILPAGAEVILVTSTAFNPLAQSFVNLNDTIYMIFQCAGNTAGHFANFNASPSIRTLTMSFSNPASCSDAVSYDRSQLVTQAGIPGAQDGAAVEYDAAGNASYVNRGCQAPFQPLSVDAGANTSVCFNGSVNLNATANGQYNSVTWSGGTGTFGSPNSLNTTYTPGAGETGTVNLTIQLISTCGNAVSDNISLTINAAPSPTVTANIASATVCSGNPITLTASGGTSYVWDNSASTAAITVSPAASTVYSVTVSNICSSTPATFSVTVNPLPVAAASSAGPYCAGDQIQLNASPGFSYSWSGPLSFSSNLENPVISNATTSMAGTYSVVVTDANSCSAGFTTNVVVNALPVMISNTPAVTITPANCGANDGAITGAGATGANPVTYQWYTSSGVALVTTQDISGMASGSYSLVATDANGCSNSAVFSITSLNGPNAPTFVSSPVVCAGGTFTLSIANPLSGAIYTWSIAGQPDQTGIDLTTITVSNADAGNIGPYTVEVNDGNCSNFATISATLGTQPLPVIAGNTGFCPGGSTILDATGSTAGVSFQWYEGGNPINGATSATYTAATAGTYQVLVTVSGGCDSLSSGINVSVLPLPAVQVSGGTGCINSTINLTASGAGTYAWTAGVSPSSGSNVTVVSAVAGVYTYTVTGTDTNNCSASAVATVTVNGNPQVTINGMDDGSIQLCPGQDTVFAGGGAQSFVWSTGDLSTYINYNAAGPDTIIVTGTDANGCSDSTSLLVVMSPGPVAPPLSGTPNVCNGYPAHMYVQDTIAGQTYQWMNASGTVLSSVDSVVIGSAGSYTLATTGQCGTTITPFTIGQSTIDVSFVADTTIGLAPLPVVFTNTSVNADYYWWVFGNGDTTTVANPATLFTSPGTYVAYLLGSNNAYCVDSYSMEIIVLAQEIYITVPNVFSPNGDGLNDFFAVKSYGISEMKLSIFNRWGILVKELKDSSEKWEPAANISEGTYFYIMTAKGLDNKEYEAQGFLMLVR